jgi:hypothetical protein
MSKDYIARDPRTGLPIATGRQQRKKSTKKQVTGPWQECSRKDILALANGEIPQLQIDWGGQRYTLPREDGIRGLGRLKGVWADRAHACLLKALESDEPSIRIAALEVLPVVAEQRSDELFDWLSVLLDDDEATVRKAASQCLEDSAPTFPSGIDSSLAQELRSPVHARSEPAWRGLKGAYRNLAGSGL